MPSKTLKRILTPAEVAELKRMARHHLRTLNRPHFVACMAPLLTLQGVESPWLTAHAIYTKRAQQTN